MARVVGIGGIFFKSPDPAVLKRWYIDNLGAPETADPGIMFPVSERLPQRYTVLGPFDEESTYFEPSTRDFMLNLVVDDLPGVLARVSAAGGIVVGGIKEYEFGRFDWFLDPDGNKVELWEPA